VGLASRARPCAALTRLFGFIATPNWAAARPRRPSQLRCFLLDPQKYYVIGGIFKENPREFKRISEILPEMKADVICILADFHTAESVLATTIFSDSF
jgi:hypothetical protein